MRKTRPKKSFTALQLDIVGQAVSISEEVVNDTYNLTISRWKQYRYEIKTLTDLELKEIINKDFAQIVRIGRKAPPGELRELDFYRICIQDHNILSARQREPDLIFLPLLTYVVTHELLHIVRFYRFDQSFEASAKERTEEEVRVHQLTYDLLNQIKLADMQVILDYYEVHRSPAA